MSNARKLVEELTDDGFGIIRPLSYHGKPIRTPEQQKEMYYFVKFGLVADFGIQTTPKLLPDGSIQIDKQYLADAGGVLETRGVTFQNY